MQYLKTLLLLTLAFASAGCEKVIDVDLNEANAQLVVLADLNLDANLIEVDLSRTTSYFAPEAPTRVTDALVELQTGSGTVQVPHAGNGVYRATTGPLSGNLTLRIQDGGVAYTALSAVPTRIPLDSIVPEFVDANAFFDGGYVLRSNWNDPAAEENHYRFRIWKNDSLYDAPEDLTVLSDQIINGQQVDFPLFPNFFQTGDSVRVEFRSISRTMYDYYETLSDITVNQGGGSTAAPANPNTNLQGGALGYFNVFAADTAGLTIP